MEQKSSVNRSREAAEPAKNDGRIRCLLPVRRGLLQIFDWVPPGRIFAGPPFFSPLTRELPRPNVSDWRGLVSKRVDRVECGYASAVLSRAA